MCLGEYQLNYNLIIQIQFNSSLQGNQKKTNLNVVGFLMSRENNHIIGVNMKPLIIFCIILSMVNSVKLTTGDFLSWKYCYYQTHKHPTLCLMRHEIKNGCAKSCNNKNASNYVTSANNRYLEINRSCRNKSTKRCKEIVQEFGESSIDPSLAAVKLCLRRDITESIVIRTKRTLLSRFLKRHCKEMCGLCFRFVMANCDQDSSQRCHDSRTRSCSDGLSRSMCQKQCNICEDHGLTNYISTPISIRPVRGNIVKIIIIVGVVMVCIATIILTLICSIKRKPNVKQRQKHIIRMTNSRVFKPVNNIPDFLPPPPPENAYILPTPERNYETIPSETIGYMDMKIR